MGYRTENIKIVKKKTQKNRKMDQRSRLKQGFV